MTITPAGVLPPREAMPPCLCGSSRYSPVHTYTSPPAGEVRFRFSSNGTYRRSLLRCDDCGHFISIFHGAPSESLYERDYVDSTYGEAGLGAAFDRIASLPESQSDNAARVRRIQEHACTHFGTRGTPASVLDVGSGLCVFLDRMSGAGWQCMALDPDERAVRHARERVGVDAICGDFMAMDALGPFDLVTFNKVLEHVPDPVAMLGAAHKHLRQGGFVYVEVPDGEQALADGPDREEFFVDHLHVFSAASLRQLAERGGFAMRRLEALREPSGKYTLAAFLVAV